ncbi:hypothetical protein BBJ28_00021215 [Nothophytophthora sp. Chile5]|nr:hypothetical protein BBJ28_00021215 [Nothophytophthora sp. Chile5]
MHIDLFSNDYIKPGCSRKGGKRGVDFFNGEDELLRYVRDDAELCARHNIAWVIVRPGGQQVIYSNADKECVSVLANADTVTNSLDNADTVRSSIGANADTVISLSRNADTACSGTGITANTGPPPPIDGESEHNGSASEGSAYEDDADTEEAEYDGADEQEANEEETDELPDIGRDSACILRTQPIAFGAAQSTDPNLLVGDDGAFLESDGEGGEDSAEPIDDISDSDDTSDSEEVTVVNDSIIEEVERVAALMTEEEVRALHLRVKGQSLLPCLALC